jgi:DNA-binding MarR family transcriptional regulator
VAADTDDDELHKTLEEDPLLRLVALAGHVTGQRFGKVMGRQHGLTPAGASVLTVLTWGAGRGFQKGTPGRATHAELARRCWIAPGTLTGVVDTLAKAGYVRRERDDKDRRVVWLVATEAGRERVGEVGRQIYEVFVPTAAEQDPEKEAVIREYLIELIMKNRDTAEECADQAAAPDRPGSSRDGEK